MYIQQGENEKNIYFYKKKDDNVFCRMCRPLAISFFFFIKTDGNFKSQKVPCFSC